MSEAEVLTTDQYYIRCENVFAGRNMIEDKSGFPKRVFCPTDAPNEPELWNIQRLPNGRYKLSARGAPVGTIDNLLFAFLTDQEKADEWIITKRKQVGPRALFTIARADGLGWIKSTNVDEPQVAVRHLIVLPSDPPQFIPNELWNIQPLVD